MRLVSAAHGVAVAAGLLLFLAMAPETRANSAPVVSNVVATQIAGTGQVRITYNVSDADGDAVYIWVTCSLDNGATFNVVPLLVTGDVNMIVLPGTGKQIIWNAAAEYPGRYFAQVVAKITVSDGPASGGEMLSVPAGSSTMGAGGSGDELPEHSVTLSAFWIDKYEVTNAQFKSFIDGGGYTTQVLWSPEGWAARQSGGWTQPA